MSLKTCETWQALLQELAYVQAEGLHEVPEALERSREGWKPHGCRGLWSLRALRPFFLKVERAKKYCQVIRAICHTQALRKGQKPVFGLGGQSEDRSEEGSHQGDPSEWRQHWGQGLRRSIKVDLELKL